jgi:methyl-accepting chemotaxis protein
LKETEQMKDMVEAICEIAGSNDISTQSVSAASEEQTAIIEQVRGVTEELANMSTGLGWKLVNLKYHKYRC